MKYFSENRLQDFEFHDAEFSNCIFSEKHLTADVKYLNIHKDTRQNIFGVDMEIHKAHINFEGFKVVSYEAPPIMEMDGKMKSCSDEEQLISYGNIAVDRFIEQLNTKVIILDLGVDDNIYYMDAMAKDLFFTVRFTFCSVKIMWDEFKKEAWYVKINN